MSPPDGQRYLASAQLSATGVEPRRELLVFRRFAVDMIAIKSEAALLWHVARKVVGAMNFGDCVVYSFDPEHNVLRQAAAIGDKTPAHQPDVILNPLTIPLGDGITGTVAQSRRPLTINDLSTDPRYIPDISMARSEICVPILNGDELLGVIDCEHPLPGQFGANELSLLSSVAALTAAQIVQCRMIRESHRIRGELARALELSQQAQRGQHRFLANASHELRTPLNAIIGFSSLLTRPGYFAADPERGELQAATILEAGEQLASMVNDILELTAAAGGRLDPKPECLDIAWEVEEAILGFRTSPGQPEINIELVGDPQRMRAWCDIRHLHKIIAKLTGHALASSGPGAPVTIRITREADQLSIAVCDRGPGLSEMALESIFAPFSEVQHAARPGAKGARLGLTLARELAQVNLAELSAASGADAGIEFTLRLPAMLEIDDIASAAAG